MKTDIILAGVGGQGILSIAAALGSAALNNNLYMKQAETHGMSQRGGDVQSFMQHIRQTYFLRSDRKRKSRSDPFCGIQDGSFTPTALSSGRRICGDQLYPFVNIPNYPGHRKIMNTLKALPHQVIINADQLAKDAAGNVRASNFVMLGAASPFIEIPFEYLEEGIRTTFSVKVRIS